MSISIGVGLFILALTLSAVFVPQLRRLHFFQALMYVAVIVLIACTAGFIQLRPRMKQWVQFFAGGFLALAYFTLIVVIAAPH